MQWNKSLLGTKGLKGLDTLKRLTYEVTIAVAPTAVGIQNEARIGADLREGDRALATKQ